MKVYSNDAVIHENNVVWEKTEITLNEALRESEILDVEEKAIVKRCFLMAKNVADDLLNEKCEECHIVFVDIYFKNGCGITVEMDENEYIALEVTLEMIKHGDSPESYPYICTDNRINEMGGVKEIDCVDIARFKYKGAKQ